MSAIKNPRHVSATFRAAKKRDSLANMIKLLAFCYGVGRTVKGCVEIINSFWAFGEEEKIGGDFIGLRVFGNLQ